MRRNRLEAEFVAYFDASAPRLRRTAYVIVRDWHSAEDIVQASFVKLYARWARVSRGGQVDAYVRRMVVNASISHLRKRRRETVTEAVPERAAIPERDEPGDLSGALAALPARQRAVIALRFLDDMSVADVASVMDVAEGTVKSQTARALETLRQHVNVHVEEQSR